jgi:hypothetical protein
MNRPFVTLMLAGLSAGALLAMLPVPPSMLPFHLAMPHAEAASPVTLASHLASRPLDSRDENRDENRVENREEATNDCPDERIQERLQAQSLDSIVKEEEDIKQTLKFSGASSVRQLVVDNVDGWIHVTAYDGQDVQLVAHKTIRAATQEALQEAKNQVKLAINDNRPTPADTIELYVDTPVRQSGGTWQSRGRWQRERWEWDKWRRREYTVQFDMELRVPRASNCALRTVNNGDLLVQGVEGIFNVENVNGGVELRDVSGAGRVYAVNGAVSVSFAKSPVQQWYIGSLNGAVNATLPPSTSADFVFKTFNGNAYTNFDVTPIARPLSLDVARNNKGKYMLRSKGEYAVRVGKGGVELSFDAFNGNINVLKREN